MSDPNFYNKLGTSLMSDHLASPKADYPVTHLNASVGDSAIVSMKRWAAASDIFRGAAETYDELPAGLYRTNIDSNGNPLLLKQKHETDGLLELPDDASLSILREFDDFWARRASFEQRGFLHKRGFMLWGPPGSGKTSCVNLLISRLIRDSQGVVLFLDQPQIAALCLRMLRMIEPDRPIVAVMEDIDALIKRYGENEYLALLDGEAQVDRIVFVATTNYPERLDRRFCDRPSRFDTVQYIGMPSPVARRAYLAAKESSLIGSELASWVAETEGFSLAHLKELIVAVKCLGQSFEKALERLEGMRVAQPSSEEEPTRRKAGFLGNSHIGSYNA